MFDIQTIEKVIGKEAVAAIHAGNLPKIDTMTLLHIWAQSSPNNLKKLALSGELLPVLKKRYQPALEQACDIRIHNPHLTGTECLQMAGLPLTL